MKKNLTSSSKLQVLIAFGLLLTLSYFSCSDDNSTRSNSRNEREDSATASSANAAAGGEETAAFSDNLYVLYVDSARFYNMIGKRGGNTQVAFQYCITKNDPNKITLCGWPSNPNGTFRGRGDTTILTATSVVYATISTTGLFFSTQKLTNQTITDIKALINQSTDVVAFYPLILATPGNEGQLVYKIEVHNSVGDISKDDGLEPLTTLFTNPAPPGVFNNLN